MGDRYQRGVALLIVLVLLAIAGVLAAGMLERQHLDLRRAGNQLLLDQARQYALGAESWAVGLLDEDARANRTDSTHDDWGLGLVTLPVEGGSISGRILDLQGRLNLNNLVLGEQVDALAVDRLRALFAQHELDEEPMAALLDWIDADSQVSGPAGAEDDWYSRLDPGYRAANHALVDTSELRSIRGMGSGYVEKLAGMITALPVPTAININTAPEPVLRALGLSEQQVSAVLERRAEKPFDKVSDLLDMTELQDVQIDTKQLGVNSSYFLLETEVHLDRVHYLQSSLIERKAPGSLSVLWRRRGEW